MKRKKKIVIWDLFGGSQNSVYKSVELWNMLNKYEIHTFDVFKTKYHDNNHIVDLSNLENFYSYIKENKIPNPDFIFASPLCQSFSIIMNCGIKNERVGWKFNKDKGIYEIRNIEEIENIIKNNNFLKQNKAKELYNRASLGKKLIDNTIEIIKNIKPFAFYIENPQTSLMWDYILFNHNDFDKYVFNNITHYNSYDLEFSLKPSNIKSNHTLNLHKFNITKNVTRRKSDRMHVNGNNTETSERVKIPALLIIDIINQFTHKMVYSNYVRKY